MNLTAAVVVCAYTERRWDDLCAAVDSALAQDPRPREVVLVVDHHEGLLERAHRELTAAVTVLANTRRRGLSGARNTAVDHVRASGGADVVAFLDDDAAARPGWLAALLAPYADPAVAAVGGTAVPRWPGGDAPAVLPPELWWVVGCTYTGQHPERGAVEVRNLMGCSMSFRLTALDAAGEFAEEMGRIGTVPLGCEETELCLRVRQYVPGARVLLEPAAVVDHRVSADRTGWSYLGRRALAEGLSKAAVTRRAGTGRGLAAEADYTRRVLPVALGREARSAVAALAAGDPAAAQDRVRAGGAIVLAVGAAGVGFLRGRAAETAPPEHRIRSGAGRPWRSRAGRAGPPSWRRRHSPPRS
ncbi:glycosyltransferase family 2 protein [Actinomycetospora flava]|uniref:Glycosyltransferase n=1 Tax=Actinomycetospora flava TaxID=3129232 RepID=A0ABU8MAA3_9PSEU